MVKKNSSDQKKVRPALTPEAREQQLVGLAVDCAEKQLLEGTAPASVVCFYLKLGTESHKLEIEKLKEENALLRAKTETLESAKRVEALYENALKAMKIYKGDSDESDD